MAWELQSNREAAVYAAVAYEAERLGDAAGLAWLRETREGQLEEVADGVTLALDEARYAAVIMDTSKESRAAAVRAVARLSDVVLVAETAIEDLPSLPAHILEEAVARHAIEVVHTVDNGGYRVHLDAWGSSIAWAPEEFELQYWANGGPS